MVLTKEESTTDCMDKIKLELPRCDQLKDYLEKQWPNAESELHILLVTELNARAILELADHIRSIYK